MELENFFSFREASLRLDTQRLTLVLGVNRDGEGFDSNGAGKSTLLEALLWGLFGETIRKVKAQEVVNRLGEGPARVAICFSLRGKEYLVERLRTGNKTELRLFAQGERIERGTYTRNQEALQEILGLDWDTFVSSVVFCHSYASAFLGGGDARRKEILEQILGLEVFSHCYEKVKEDFEETARRHSTVFGKLQSLSPLPSRIRQDLENLSSSLTEKVKRLREQKEQLERTVAALEDAIATRKKQCEEYAQALAEVNFRLADYQTRITPILERLRQEKEKWSKLQAEYEATRKITERKVTELQNRIHNLTEHHLGKPCPVCRRVITENELPFVLATTTGELQHILEELEEVRGKIRECSQNITALEEEEKALPLERFVADLNLREDLNQKLFKEKQELSILEERCALLKRQWQALDLDQEVETLRSLKVKKEEELKRVEEEITKLTEEEQRLRRELEILSFWKNGFGNGGVKSWVINSYLSAINERLSFYLTALGFDSLRVALVPVFVSRKGMEIDRLEFVVEGEGASSYASLSSGERRRVDLAVLFTLQDLVFSNRSRKSNVFFYDEIFDTLDERGVERVVELLKSMHQGMTVFVISHNNDLRSYFDHFLTVVKEGGVSRIA